MAGRDNQLRALRAIEAIARQPATAAELSRALGVNRSSALRLARELVADGWATRDASQRYVAGGPRLWNLLHLTPDEGEVQGAIVPMLAQMRDWCGESACFAVHAGEAMVYTTYLPASHDVQLIERLGSTRPVHCSALGKAWLSALAPNDLQKELERLSFVGGTEKAPKSATELRAIVEADRTRGFSLDLGETIASAHCVAVPVWISGSLRGAAGVQGPSTRLGVERLMEIGERLLVLLGQVPLAVPSRTGTEGN